MQDLTYGYDTAGNVRWIVDARNSGQRQCFSYDGLDRLLSGFTTAAGDNCTGYTSVGNGPYNETYSYTPNGNLVSKTGQGTYSYGVAQASTCPEGALVKKHAVVSTSNGSSYCYDQNGNMRRRTIGGNTYTLTYDDENRLVSVSGAATASFVYDADGNRVKSVMNGETVTTIGNLYEKKVVGGATTHTKYYYFNGQRVAVRVAGVLYWLLRDHLGSTTVTANGASGVREAELWYKPWGETRGTPYQTTPTKRRFTGQALDEVAGGLYFYNARYYDPTLARFIS
ncbi:MAG: RHS repeat-associated core domain-containing protein, partial [Anaerolineae bacterium]